MGPLDWRGGIRLGRWILAQTCASFQQLVDFLGTKGLENENAVPVAERFMEAANVDFDADGNFAPMAVDYAGGELKRV